MRGVGLLARDNLRNRWGLHSCVWAQIKEEELLYHVTLSFFLISILYFIKFKSNLSINFGDFLTFYIDLKKILAINYKKGQCYGIAWLFHFKRSPNTAMYSQRLRRLSTFCPVQSTFELLLSKASRDAGGGVHILQPISVRSRLLLTFTTTPYPAQGPGTQK